MWMATNGIFIKEAFGDLPKLDSVCIELSEENEDMVKIIEEKGFVLKNHRSVLSWSI